MIALASGLWADTICDAVLRSLVRVSSVWMMPDIGSQVASSRGGAPRS